MHPNVARALDYGYGALNWWLEGLWTGLPLWLRGELFTPRTELVVRLGADTATVEKRGAEPVTVTFGDESARSAVESLLAGGDISDVIVVLPPRTALTHTFRFPVTAEGDLRSVLLHELDRSTPFAIDDVVFDHAVRQRDDTTLLTDVALIPRASLTEILATVTRIGLQPTVVTADDALGARLPLNLLLRRRRLQLPVARLSLRPALGLGALLLVAAALYVPLSRYDHLITARQTLVEQVRAEAVAARDRLTEQEAALTRGEFLAERRSHYVPPIALLLELTAQIPEHTWVSRFAVSRGEMQLQGESSAATELLQVLEPTELLREVRFQAPVSRSSESGKEQFSIVAKLERGAP